MNSEKLFTLFVGGRGAGKTYAGASKALKESGLRKCYGLVAAPTYPALRDYAIKTFLEVAGTAVIHFNKTEHNAYMRNGSVIFFRSADDPDSLRGPDVSWAWLDEPRNMKAEVWKIVIPCLREGGRAGKCWLTTTPDGKASSWIYDRFVTRGGKNYESFHATSYDNPFVSEELLQAIQEDYGFGAWGKQELGGEWVDPEGALFRRQDLKIIESVPEGLDLIRSWDLALTTNETSCSTAGVLIGMDDEGNVYIVDVVHGKWEWPDVRKIIIQTALADGIGIPLTVEKTGFQTVAIQELLREEELYNHIIHESIPDKDKLTRALPVASRARAGKVFLKMGAWNATLIDEFTSFTGAKGETNDQVDGASQGYHWVTTNATDLSVMKI